MSDDDCVSVWQERILLPSMALDPLLPALFRPRNLTSMSPFGVRLATSPEFNPKRLTLARRRRGLTKIRLAQLLGVEVRAIAAYENDEYRPDRECLHQLADKRHFPVLFVFGDDLHDISSDIVSFRSMSKMTAGQRDAALGAGAIALLFSEWIDARFACRAA